MQDAERIAQQQTAKHFWETHFEDLLDTPITEQVALDINLWERLQDTFAIQDKDTLWAVIATRIVIPIQSTQMAMQIIRLAKRAIDSNDNMPE